MILHTKMHRTKNKIKVRLIDIYKEKKEIKWFITVNALSPYDITFEDDIYFFFF